MAKELVLVGKFGAAHGIKGEVRLQSFTGDPAAINRYGPLSDLKGRQFTLTSLRPVKGDLFVARVEGIKDRTAAEALVNVELFVDRAVLPPPDEDEFYLTDLIGLDARDTAGVRIGTILNVLNFGGGDILEVVPEGGGETWLLPFTKEVVPEIDLSRRQVTVVPPVEIEASGDDEDAAQPSEPQDAALSSSR
ncbi:ribosome maturation factor RimM [Methyloferula stellata]|uniref:ribosome maturation factor RimM n=1 Tax=Methyloferula stellata TaxID=876270 RepID=UPI00036CEDB4|nr:ribosome maturation factor RimM [Methyloferula stellata]